MTSRDQAGDPGGIDWTGCPDVERTADTVSGHWRLKGTRIPVEDLLVNAEDQTPEQIKADIYPSLPLDRIRRVIAFARQGEHAASA